MTKTIRILAALAVATAVVVLSACGGDDDDSTASSGVEVSENCDRQPEFPVVAPAKADRSYKIAAILPHTQVAYTQSVQWGLEEEAKELGVDIDVVDAGGYANVDRQIGQVETAITEGVDSIIMYPVDPSALSPVVQQGADAGITMVGLISPGASGLDEYPALESLETILTADYETNAYEVSKCLIESVGGEGEFFYVQGGAGSAYARDSEAGVRAAIKEYPGMTLVGTEITAGFATADAQEAAEDALAANPGINVLYCDTSEQTTGCAAAVSTAGRIGEVAVGGIDPSGPPDVAALESGDFSVILGEAPVLMGRGAVDLAVAALNGEKVPAEVVIEGQDQDMYTSNDPAALEEDMTDHVAPPLLD
jgi:ABC-type sugar transport system substrate-binding protein